MAVTIINNNTLPAGGSGVSWNVTIASTTAANTLILCFNGWTTTGSTPTVSSISGGGTWTLVKSAGGVPDSEIWWCPNCAGGVTAITITINNAGANQTTNGTIFEFAGMGTNPKVDTTNSNTGSGGTTTTGSVTPTFTSDVCLAAMSANGSNVTYAGGPTNSWFTGQHINRFASAYKIPGSTAAQSTGWTYTGSSVTFRACIAGFYPQFVTTQTITGQAFLTTGAATVQQQLMMMGVGS